jgi:hypothetical protein
VEVWNGHGDLSGIDKAMRRCKRVTSLKPEALPPIGPLAVMRKHRRRLRSTDARNRKRWRALLLLIVSSLY